MKNNHGLTLVETIIYIAIVSVVLVAVISFSQRIISLRTKSRTIEEVQQNARFAMDRMAQEIRSSESFVITDPSSLQLVRSTDDIYFQLNSENQLTMKIGASGTEQELTNNLLEVENLTFTELSNSTMQSAVKIDLLIKFSNDSNLTEYDWDLNLEDTVTIRKP